MSSFLFDLYTKILQKVHIYGYIKHHIHIFIKHEFPLLITYSMLLMRFPTITTIVTAVLLQSMFGQVSQCRCGRLRTGR